MTGDRVRFLHPQHIAENDIVQMREPLLRNAIRVQLQTVRAGKSFRVVASMSSMPACLSSFATFAVLLLFVSCEGWSLKSSYGKRNTTRMWADAKRDGRPAEYRWRPLRKLCNSIPCSMPQILADARCSSAVR